MSDPVALPLNRQQLGSINADPRIVKALEQLFQQALQLTPATLQAMRDDIVALTQAAYVVLAASTEIPNARRLTGATGITFDTSAPGIVELIVNISAILGFLPVRDSEPFVTYGGTGTLSNDRVLSGGSGVSIDLSAPGLAAIIVNVATALGFTPARNDEPYITASATGGLSADRVLSGGTGVSIDLATAGLAKVLVNVVTALGYTPANAAGQAFGGAVSATALTASGVVHGASFKTDQTATATATPSNASIPIDVNGTTYYMRLSTTP